MWEYLGQKAEKWVIEPWFRRMVKVDSGIFWWMWEEIHQ
jgi:hypothetical protein